MFIGIMGGGTIGLALARRDVGAHARVGLALGAVGLVLAALEASGSLDDRSGTWWPGIPVGLACAALGFAVARSLLGRVRGRLDADTAGSLPLYADVAAGLAAGLSVLFPPLALVVLGVLAWLAVGGRRREGEKYAGLRILR